MNRPALVPLPHTVTMMAGRVTVPREIHVSSFMPLGLWLERGLQDWLNTQFMPADVDSPAWLVIQNGTDLDNGSYRLRIGQPADVKQGMGDGAGTAAANGVVLIESGDREGVINAAQTLRQLAGPGAYSPSRPPAGPAVQLPCLEIRDSPAFGFRSVLLDVARHFMPKDELLRFIDLASAHKLNAIHLHLTDDQGWRIDIPALPRLREVASFRSDTMQVFLDEDAQTDEGRFMTGRPHGGCYSLEELREVVAYAMERGVTIVPEIDVPGHSVAAIAAYPQLGVDNPEVGVWTDWGINDCILDPSDYTLDFYRTVLDTVMEVFDSPVVHLGGDEVPYERWHASETVQRRATALGLDSVELLHGWFLGQLASHLEANGRRAGVWHEAVSSTLPRTAVVNAWGDLNTVVDSLAAGHDTIVSCCSHLYLDYRESGDPREPSACIPLLSTEKLYGFTPLPGKVLSAASTSSAAIRGIQAQLWTEYLDTREIRDYNSFPRLSAFAELAWGTAEDFAGFVDRLRKGHLDRLTAAGVDFRPLDGPHPWQERPDLALKTGRIPKLATEL